MNLKIKCLLITSMILASWSSITQATVVEIRTSLGIIEVNLFDETTPETVNNFLTYVNAGAFENNVIHRSVNNFIVQGGGFQYNGPIALNADNTFSIDAVPANPAVVNEPTLSNVRGTIAMAKIGGNANSATSQWFFNLSNNSAGNASLDTQNGGFTVFGQVLGDGMQIVDAIAALQVFGGAGNFLFREIPVRSYTAADLENRSDLTDDNLVIISDIVVTDPATNTHSDINPTVNTLINGSGGGSGDPSSGSGGGAIGWLLLFGLMVLIYSKRAIKAHE